MPELINDGCPFCIENGKLDVLAWYPGFDPVEDAEILLVRDAVFTDVYLGIPRVHCERYSQLPRDFTQRLKRMLVMFDGDREIILTTNLGLPAKRAAGTSVQTVAHMHTKIILVPNDISVLGLTSYHRLERELQTVLPGTSITELVMSAVQAAELRRDNDYGLN